MILRPVAALLLAAALVACRPSSAEVIARGDRVLSISRAPRQEPAPITAQDFADAYTLAASAGARGDFHSAQWSSLEPQAGTFALTDLRNGLRFAASSGLTVLLGIQVLNTTAKETPADLRGVAFDDARMRTRFHTLVDSLLPDLTHVTYLSIGNEVDPYLSAHPAEWTTYKTFLGDAIAYVHSVAPGVKVGVTATFDGANGTAAANVAALNTATDVYILTYYPLTTGFGVRAPDAPLTDLPRMVSLAGAKQLIIQEAGYPASELLGSSELRQSQFVTNLFDAWAPRGDRIPFLNVFLMHDFTQTLCDYFTQYYGLPGDQRFSQFLCTLGLRKANGTPRLAWATFVEAGRKVSPVR